MPDNEFTDDVNIDATQGITVIGTGEPVIVARRESATVGHEVGIDFELQNDAGTPEDIVYGAIRAQIVDETDGTEDGVLSFQVMTGGSLEQKATLGSGGTFTSSGANFSGATVANLIASTSFQSNGTTSLGDDVSDDTTVSGDLKVDVDLDVDGNTSLGNADTDTITCEGRLIKRFVNAAIIDATVAGSTGEVVFNTNDTKFYGCTIGGGAGSATWVAFH